VDGNSTLSGNVLIRGNLHLRQNYTIEKLLFVNGNSIHLGVIAPLTLDAPLYNVNLLSNARISASTGAAPPTAWI
jgi:hypothetical protein